MDQSGHSTIITWLIHFVLSHLKIHHNHQRDDHHCRHNQQNIQRDSNTVAQTNPIEHHGKQFQESVHEYETHHTETKDSKIQGRHTQLRGRVLGLSNHGLSLSNPYVWHRHWFWAVLKFVDSKFEDDMVNYVDRFWDFPTMASVTIYRIFKEIPIPWLKPTP